MDGLGNEKLNKNEGKVEGEGNKGGDARTIGESASAGTSVGVIAGAAAGHAGMGAGIGAAAGAAAGILGVLLTRGPDVVLARGSTVEMVLDRAVHYDATELDFTNGMRPVAVTDAGTVRAAEAPHASASWGRRPFLSVGAFRKPQQAECLPPFIIPASASAVRSRSPKPS